MKNLWRFFVVFTATVFFVSCGDDDPKTEECDPPCGTEACEECIGGECVVVCEEGEECIGGECVDPSSLICDPQCDSNACEGCIGGECVVICEEDEECIGGECVDPSSLVCDPECDSDACEECVGGECVVVCKADEECVDGDCIKKPTELEGTVLADSAATMNYGDIYDGFESGASYKAWIDGAYDDDVISSVGGLFTWNVLNNNSSEGYQPVGVYNPVNKRCYWFLDRTAGGNEVESVAIISYDPFTHTFYRLPRVDDNGNFGSPHTYGRWALDVGRQKIYRKHGSNGGGESSVPSGTLWVYDIATEQWEAQDYIAPFGSAIAMHEEWGELLYMDNSGVIRSWDPDTYEIREVGSNPNMTSYHAHAHYNWTRKEWYIAMGNASNNLGITIVKNNGDVVPLLFPEELVTCGNASARHWYDPQSGDYLFTCDRSNIYSFNPDTDIWSGPYDHGSWPPYHGIVPCPIDDLGITMSIHRGAGVRLYRHDID